jgi:hypothetical protein
MPAGNDAWPSSLWAALRLPVWSRTRSPAVYRALCIFSPLAGPPDDPGVGEAAIPPVVRPVIAHRVLGETHHAELDGPAVLEADRVLLLAGKEVVLRASLDVLGQPTTAARFSPGA